MFVGLVTLSLGIAVLVWPSETLTVLSILVGLQVLLFGLFRLISAFSSSSIDPGLVGFTGVIGMVVGVVVLRHPFETVAVLATLLGVVIASWPGPTITGVVRPPRPASVAGPGQ